MDNKKILIILVAIVAIIAIVGIALSVESGKSSTSEISDANIVENETDLEGKENYIGTDKAIEIINEHLKNDEVIIKIDSGSVTFSGGSTAIAGSKIPISGYETTGPATLEKVNSVTCYKVIISGSGFTGHTYVNAETGELVVEQ